MERCIVIVSHSFYRSSTLRPLASSTRTTPTSSPREKELLPRRLPGIASRPAGLDLGGSAAQRAERRVFVLFFLCLLFFLFFFFYEWFEIGPRAHPQKSGNDDALVCSGVFGHGYQVQWPLRTELRSELRTDRSESTVEFHLYDRFAYPDCFAMIF